MLTIKALGELCQIIAQIKDGILRLRRELDGATFLVFLDAIDEIIIEPRGIYCLETNKLIPDFD